ncbi:MAG TPA: 2-phosphosulfolactate phosphatase [Thermoleophilaceae bacterium]|nr:2-phosphosulfolactate phosphatase [Thermoleophilaceae bacterium]
MPKTVAIDCYHGHLPHSADGTAIGAVDVLRATTTAVTAVKAGWRVFVSPTLDAAVPLAARLADPVLAGELGGNMPYGFHMQNSPCAVSARPERRRPLILLSTSGTHLMAEAAASRPTYAASLRNVPAQAEELAGYDHVVLLGADSRGEFRLEDQLCCARVGKRLLERGFEPADAKTAALVERLGDAPEDVMLESRSVRYLRDTGQDHDVRFVLEHVDDLRTVFPILDGEVQERAVA